jgi:hypothetical protein
MKKLLVLASGIVAASVALAVAQDGGIKPAKHGGGIKPAKHDGGIKPAKHEKQPDQELKDLTLIGTITKKEVQGKGKLADKQIVSYVLTTDAGVEVRLPKDETKFTADNLNVRVKVVGTGFMDEAKKKGAMKTVTSVEKVLDAAAAPAAAPAPDPAAAK